MTSRALSGSYENLAADDAVESAVDAAKSWLFDGYAKIGGGAQDDLDLAPIAMDTIRQYGIQHSLNDLWNRCYWQGWRLKGGGGGRKLEAGCIRHSQNILKHTSSMAWRAMPSESRRAFTRTVMKVASGHRRRIRVGRPSSLSRKPPRFFLNPMP